MSAGCLRGMEEIRGDYSQEMKILMANIQTGFSMPEQKNNCTQTSYQTFQDSAHPPEPPNTPYFTKLTLGFDFVSRLFLVLAERAACQRNSTLFHERNGTPSAESRNGAEIFRISPPFLHPAEGVQFPSVGYFFQPETRGRPVSR